MKEMKERIRSSKKYQNAVKSVKDFFRKVFAAIAKVAVTVVLFLKDVLSSYSGRVENSKNS